MERYEVQELPDGVWIVVDNDSGNEVYESLDEWKARDWCHDLNIMDSLESEY